MTDRWFDDAAGPVVRPYAMTRGRTRVSADGAQLDLIAQVVAEPPDSVLETAGDEATAAADGAADEAYNTALHADRSLAPEHIDIVLLCRDSPLSVAEVAAELDLPVGVVRVLIGDLLDAEWVRASRPVPPAELPDESILREVIDGLRAL